MRDRITNSKIGRILQNPDEEVTPRGLIELKSKYIIGISRLRSMILGFRWIDRILEELNLISVKNKMYYLIIGLLLFVLTIISIFYIIDLIISLFYTMRIYMKGVGVAYKYYRTTGLRGIRIVFRAINSRNWVNVPGPSRHKFNGWVESIARLGLKAFIAFMGLMAATVFFG